MFNTCVIEHLRAALALASAKSFVSSYLSVLSFSHDSLLPESGAVSVTELSLTKVCFRTLRLVSQVLASSKIENLWGSKSIAL
jgi:hypothetical protein